MMHHLATLVWLRFTLFRHSLTRLSSVLSLLVTVTVTVGALFAGVAIALILMVLFATEDDVREPIVILALVDGMVFVFAFLLGLGLLMEIQRSETIDLRRMLYLPVSPRTVFGLNLAVSMISPTPVLFLLPAAGLTIGLTISMGPWMLLIFPLAVLFFLMVSIWLYCVRGFLARLMENKRRRRLVLVLVPAVFILIAQIPNLLVIGMNTRRRLGSSTDDNGAATEQQREPKEERSDSDRLRDIEDKAVLGNAVIPLGWLPLGVYSLATGRTATAAGCFAGITLLNVLGFSLSYRSTYRYYRGDVKSAGATTRSKKRKADASAQAKPGKRSIVERGLPLFDEDTAAFAWTQLQVYLRLPQVRMLLIMPIIFCVIFVVAPLVRGVKVESDFIRSAAIPLLPLWCILMSSMWLYNIFGTDGNGFRALILLPTSRHKYLLGKNLAFLPILAVQCGLLMAAAAILLRPTVSAIVIAVLQMIQGYLAFCIYGNIASIFFPFRIRPETMRANDVKGMTILISLVALPIVGALALPTLLAATIDPTLREFWGMPGYVPAGVMVSLAFLALTILLYRFMLRPTGALLLRREQRILEVLMRDKE